MQDFPTANSVKLNLLQQKKKLVATKMVLTNKNQSLEPSQDRNIKSLLA